MAVLNKLSKNTFLFSNFIKQIAHRSASPLQNRCNLYIGRVLSLKHVQAIAFTDRSRKNNSVQQK